MRDGQGHTLRTVSGPDGHRWFVVQDICRALGLSNSSRSLCELDPDEKGHTKLSTLGGAQTFATVNQSGLYTLAFQSRKPAAREFRKWVTSIVVPAIYRDGVYVRGEEGLLSAATPEELRARIQELEGVAASGLAAKEHRGIDRLEERSARDGALKAMSKLRRPKLKKPKRPGTAKQGGKAAPW